jgi:hypothetical protein
MAMCGGVSGEVIKVNTPFDYHLKLALYELADKAICADV